MIDSTSHTCRMNDHLKIDYCYSAGKISNWFYFYLKILILWDSNWPIEREKNGPFGGSSFSDFFQRFLGLYDVILVLIS